MSDKHWITINKTDTNSLISVLEQEIQWCKDHSQENRDEFQKGFIAGLNQAKDLISKVIEVWKQPR